ncbi:transposable element Tcb2 transposase [Trichonephila clavipes]|uniref:Transposable element Tcb2 transposase n=1 Tax=Trichonephila clavipes TaxID=2585209 RepID=A0A8X6T8U2_TRICX|nr:transposable element Tcb2 transposase [Trichonephila clavipes]
MRVCGQFSFTLTIGFNFGKQFQESGYAERKPGQGHPRAMMARKDYHLSIIGRSNSDVTVSELSLLSTLLKQKRKLTWQKLTFIPAVTQRARNPSNLLSYAREINHCCCGGLLVWAGILLDFHKQLYVLERGYVTAVLYRDEVLEIYVHFFRGGGAVDRDFILMDENARPHRAHTIDEFLENEDICWIDWPAKSSDPNPIEHVGHALGSESATRNSHVF